MAPKAKPAAKAKGKVAKTAAKTAAKSMVKPRFNAAKVKAEKTPPKTKREPATKPAPEDSTATIGFARGTISALLTSLKYQAGASKSATAEQKADAQKTLEDRSAVVCLVAM